MKTKYFLLVGLSLFSLLTGCNSKPEKGDQGIQGEQGEKGDKGEAGKDGSKIYTGEGVPDDNTGVEGDLYIDTSTWNLYTKGSDKWSLTGNIKGDTGSSGVSVTNTYIDDDGNLICELSNGQTVNAGKVKDTTKHTVNYYVDGTLYDSIQVLDGSKITAPEFNVYNGYELSEWYTIEYGHKIPWSFVGSTVTCDIDLYIDKVPIVYTITYVLNDSYNSSDNPSTYTVISDDIELKAPFKEGYYFLGWYSDSAFKTACSTITKGSMGDKTFYAKFMKNSEAESLAAKPIVDETNKTIKYGLYPQTHVTDTTIISKLNSLTTVEGNDWYLLDNTYYAKATGDPSRVGNTTFSDGSTITSGTIYWFKCEPITWKIIASSDNTYTVLTEKLLDVSEYGQYSTYNNSTLRTFMNETFFNSAFYFNSSIIQTVEVDNSAATTMDSNNKYASANTNDKLYALSYKDYLNADYGFSTDTASSTTRCALATDYMKAKRGYADKTTSYGIYWTRSPAVANSSDISYIFASGSIGTNSFNQDNCGVRPSMQIKIK